MENISIVLTSKKDILLSLSLYVNGNFNEELLFNTTELDEVLTSEEMNNIWNKFKGGKFNIPLDRMVYYLYKSEYGDTSWKVFKLLYLLDKCSGIGKFEKFFGPNEQIEKIKSLITNWGTTEEMIKEQIIQLDMAILSVIAELEIASILIENKLDIEFIQKTGARADIKFIRNGFIADVKYTTPYKSCPPIEDFITYKTIIKDLLITLRKYADEHNLEKSDIIIINSIHLYYQRQFSNFLFELGKIIIPPEAIDIDCDSERIVFDILQIKDAMDKAFEIIKSCDKAMMLFFDGKRLSGGFRALVFPASFISNCVKYEDHRRVYEIKNT